MTIRVRFFAALRERLGTQAIDITASSSIDLSELLDLIQKRIGAEAIEILSAPNVRIALNQEFVTDPYRISDGDEIAFLPPITGG